MPRSNQATKKAITIGLDPEETDIVQRTMSRNRCSQSAAVRLLIRNGAPHTPMDAPSPPEGQHTHD